jgi:hypothetical protein
MPRVREDIKDCLRFIARQPWGRPEDRKRDIERAIGHVQHRPSANRIAARRRRLRLELRRHNAAQFAIVYAYFQPSEQAPEGVVSIRAVRHRRVRDVFAGVREPWFSYGGRAQRQMQPECRVAS